MVVSDKILNLLLINKFEFNRLIHELEEKNIFFDQIYSQFPIIVNFNDLEIIKNKILNKEVDLYEFVNIISKINLHIESENANN